jgi:sugar phosphate isomerase/epimerase
MDDLGLRGGAWTLPVYWRNEADRYREDLRSLPRFARAAARLGLQRTGTWVLPELKPDFFHAEDPDEAFRRTREQHVDRLGSIARILADHGIALGLEVMGSIKARTGSRVPFVERYADLDRLLGELRARHANIGILADSFHLFAAGENVEAGLVWGAGAVTSVHVADPAHANREGLADHERELPGSTGVANCRGLLRILSVAEYRGPVTAEPLGECRSLRGLDALTIARRTRAALQSVWPD